MSASTVKWTSLNPFISLSESDSKQSTNFELFEEKNLTHSKNLLIYKAKQFTFTKKSQKISTYFTRRCI